jgi:hypothetical protein
VRKTSDVACCRDRGPSLEIREPVDFVSSLASRHLTSWTFHGFLGSDPGALTLIDFPGVGDFGTTGVEGINDAGQFVEYFLGETDSAPHGFLATPSCDRAPNLHISNRIQSLVPQWFWQPAMRRRP